MSSQTTKELNMLQMVEPELYNQVESILEYVKEKCNEKGVV